MSTVQEQRKKYYDSHRDQIRARAREYYQRNRESKLAKANAYYAAHKGYVKDRYIKNKAAPSTEIPKHPERPDFN